jgi:CheY-like chemotaxis protein
VRARICGHEGKNVDAATDPKITDRHRGGFVAQAGELMRRKDATPITILLAEDDADDRKLTQEAFDDGRLMNDLRFVEDGEELLEYLKKQGRYAPPVEAPRPGLILLDLNMPRKDGRAVLAEIKNDPDLRTIPVVILTISKADEDVYRSYDLGVNSYIVKPVTFDALADTLQTLEKYWFEIVELPPHKNP